MSRGLVAALIVLLGFAPTLIWIWDGWFLEGGYFGHGPLLVLATLGLLVLARDRYACAEAGRSILGLCGLVACLVVHLGAQALLVDGVSGLVLVPALMCAVLAVDGWARFVRVAPALGCLFFAVPLPIFVTGRLAYTLKHIATSAATSLGQFLGLGLRQQGAAIDVGAGELLVVGDACSGLRSLVALLAIGYIYAMFLTRRPLFGRFVFVLLAGPIALASNFLRITALAAIAKWQGVAAATGWVHDVSGWLVYAIALALLLAVDKVLPGKKRRGGSSSASPGRVSPSSKAAPATSHMRAVVLAVVILGAPACFLGFNPPPRDLRGYASAVPKQIGRFQGGEDYRFPESWYGLLGTRDVCWRPYRDPRSGLQLDLTAIFQGASWKSLHPPEVCLQSAGFELRAEERRSIEVGGERVVLTLLEVERLVRSSSKSATEPGDSVVETVQRSLVFYLFGDHESLTPSFYAFFLRNVPRALFRQRSRGFLLRLDVPWPERVQRERVEAIVHSFLLEAIPQLQSLLRRELPR